jgi:hypothetical protein
MTTEYDSALAVSQMLIGNLMKTRKVTVLTKDIIREQADIAASLIGGGDIDATKLAEELLSRFNIFVQQASILVEDDEHVSWLSTVDKSQWRFWPRCQKYLLGQLPEPVVHGIDEDTNRILDLLGDPSDANSWDRRGLVVGDVQFGKTGNYSALACKAADTGYKMIIVLAGMHESLRMQTQIRMDDAFLGFRTDHTRAPTGVGLFDPGVPAVAATARSLRGDFNKIMAGQLVLSPDAGPPMLLVVKKNAMMLRNLHSWLDKMSNATDDKGRRTIRSTPALIIDDESDNASVDTLEQDFSREGEPDPDHKPTTINGLIRQILDLFEKRSYVGYMHLVGKTPRDFGLKVRKHPVLAPTAPNKRRHARDIVLYISYAGGISESKSFSLEEPILKHNMIALDQLVRTLNRQPPVHPKYDGKDGATRDYATSNLWTEIEWETVRLFLSAYQTEKSATRANSRLWVSYVERQIRASGELKKWNIVLMSGDGKSYNVSGIQIKGRRRAPDEEIAVDKHSYHIKRLVTPRDAGVDLTSQAWEDARSSDPLNRLDGTKRREPTAFGISVARKNQQLNPLLMIYLPFAETIRDMPTPVVGVAISFPGSDRSIAETLRYTANTVLQEQMETISYLDEDDTIDND